MKTLRIVRNIAVLFLLVVALLAARPGLGKAHPQYVCGYDVGRNCTFNFLSGDCSDSPCKKGQTCSDSGCVRFCPFGCK